MRHSSPPTRGLPTTRRSIAYAEISSGDQVRMEAALKTPVRAYQVPFVDSPIVGGW